MSYKVSVVITTYNDWDRLRLTLHGFERQRGYPFQVIVISDGETDEGFQRTQELVSTTRSVNYNTYECDRLLPITADFRLAASRNLGISKAKGDRIVICDCDTIPGFDFIYGHEKLPANVVGVGLRKRISIASSERLFSVHLPDYHVLDSLVYADDDRITGNRAVEFTDLSRHLNKAPWKICWGCNFSMPRSAAEKLGGFDMEFVGWGGEDEDMAERLYRSGYEFQAMPTSYVYHLDHHARTPQRAAGTFARKIGGPLVRNNGSLVGINGAHVGSGV